MIIRIIFILFVPAALFVSAAYAGQSYTVTLTDGNTLTTNSYRMEEGKVYLKYPVGEVAVPASEVASVSSGDGGVELLQTRGVLQPGPGPRAAQGPPAVGPSNPLVAAPAAAPPPIDALRERLNEHRRLLLERRRQAITAVSGGTGAVDSPAGSMSQGGGDPQTDALIEQLSTVDDAHRAEVEQKLEKRLDSFFEGTLDDNSPLHDGP